MVFSNILDYVYAIYEYPNCDNNVRIFELERLGKQITENGFRGKKREVIQKYCI